MSDEKTYTLRCRRCGRTFTSKKQNVMYCSEPSPYPEDNGRSCQNMRRLESKYASRRRERKLRADINSGDIIITTKFGYIPRTELFSKFRNEVMERHNFKTYGAFQNWAAENPEEYGEEYSQFQRDIGMQNLTK